jgi:hypothetical protein
MTRRSGRNWTGVSASASGSGAQEMRPGAAVLQEDPEVRGGVGIAKQSSSIVSFHKSTTSSSSYSLPIVQARPQHTSRKLLDPLIEPLRTPSPKYHHRGTANRCHHGSPRGVFLQPSSTHYNPRQASSSPTEPRHHRTLLVADLAQRGNSLYARSPPQPRLPQGLP